MAWCRRNTDFGHNKSGLSSGPEPCDFELPDLGQWISQDSLEEQNHLQAGGPGRLSKDQATKGANGVNLRARAGEDQRPSSVVRKKGSNWSFQSLFVLSRPSEDWMMPTHIREGSLLPSVYWFERWSHPDAPSQTHPDRTLSQISGCPVIQSGWHMKWTITDRRPNLSCLQCFHL